MIRAFILGLIVVALSSCCDNQTVDIQAHRGGMGLMPENTLDAMLNAVYRDSKR